MEGTLKVCFYSLSDCTVNSLAQSSQSVIRRGGLGAHVCLALSATVCYFLGLASAFIQLLLMIKLISLLHKNPFQRKIINAFANVI